MNQTATYNEPDSQTDQLAQVAQLDQPQPENLDMLLTNVYNDNRQTVMGASLCQLVSHCNFLVTKPINNNKTKDNNKFRPEYQKKIDHFLKTRLIQSVQIFQECLKCENMYEWYLKYHTIFAQLPFGKFIRQPLKGSNQLKVAKIGDIIQAIKQRIVYIINCPIPAFYINHKDYLHLKKYYSKMQYQMNMYWSEIDCLEDDWVACIDEAKKAQHNAYHAFNIKKSFYVKNSVPK